MAETLLPPVMPRSDGGQIKTKEVVLNDVTNTGVMAALVGGFALSCVQAGHYDHANSNVDNISYLLLIFAVHACTCSALTSALLYRTVNSMPESDVPPWAATTPAWMMLLMPMAKFGMGTASYIISVIFTSFHSLEEAPTPRARPHARRFEASSAFGAVFSLFG